MPWPRSSGKANPSATAALGQQCCLRPGPQQTPLLAGVGPGWNTVGIDMLGLVPDQRRRYVDRKNAPEQVDPKNGPENVDPKKGPKKWTVKTAPKSGPKTRARKSGPKKRHRTVDRKDAPEVDRKTGSGGKSRDRKMDRTSSHMYITGTRKRGHFPVRVWGEFSVPGQNDFSVHAPAPTFRPNPQPDFSVHFFGADFPVPLPARLRCTGPVGGPFRRPPTGVLTTIAIGHS